MEVIYTPSNVTPQFYHDLYEGKKKKFMEEYEYEKNFIYKVGDVSIVVTLYLIVPSEYLTKHTMLYLFNTK